VRAKLGYLVVGAVCALASLAVLWYGWLKEALAW
jgi:hypothetical protein